MVHEGQIDLTSQTLVYNPLHLHHMLAAIIDTFPVAVFFPHFKTKLDANALFGTFHTS
jgi:hypothetical protein